MKFTTLIQQANDAARKKSVHEAEAVRVAKAMGVDLDDELLASAAKLSESSFPAEYGITPDQICDQICNHIAPMHGSGAGVMSSAEFKKYARVLRGELEDEYDEVYSNAQWNKKVDAAYNSMKLSRATDAEEEELGWPDEVSNDEVVWDENPETFGNNNFDFEDPDMETEEEEDGEVVDDVEMPVAATSPASDLQSLNISKDEARRKAAEASKAIESEGSRAFHEFRVAAERNSPYSPDAKPDEHLAWLKGWSRAATAFYAPPKVAKGRGRARR